MAIKKVEIERLTVQSTKSFEAVVAALKAAVGQPDMVEFFKETRGRGPSPTSKARFKKASVRRG